jgi:hypothetical protein
MCQRGRRTILLEPTGTQHALTPQQRLPVLDSWMKSGLPAGDYAPLVSVSKHTLYLWKQCFEKEGPAGLSHQPRGAKCRSDFVYRIHFRKWDELWGGHTLYLGPLVAVVTGANVTTPVIGLRERVRSMTFPYAS